MIPLSEFRPQGVVFDLDGTLTDNMACHAEAFGLFLRHHGLPEMTMAMRQRLDGKRNSEIFPILFDRELTLDELRAFAEEKESAYRELSRERLDPLPGALTLLERLAARGIGVAVATSAPEKNVAHTLSAIGLADRIGVITRSDAVPRGKPFPDVFLRAAHELGVAPEACLAFKDAPVGLRRRGAPGCGASRSPRRFRPKRSRHPIRRRTLRIATSRPISTAREAGWEPTRSRADGRGHSIGTLNGDSHGGQSTGTFREGLVAVSAYNRPRSWRFADHLMKPAPHTFRIALGGWPATP